MQIVEAKYVSLFQKDIPQTVYFSDIMHLMV